MKVLLISTLAILTSGLVSATETVGTGISKVKSQFSVKATNRRLVNILNNKKMTVFNQVEHDKNAQSVGLELSATKLVIFGNPKMGTKLMQCAPSVAIDLPMKFLINKDSNGQVWISYNSPQYLVERHNIKGCEAIVAKMTGALANISSKAGNSIQ